MLALVLAFSLIAVGCGGGDDDSSSESSSDTTSASSEEEAPAAEEEAEEESAPEPVSGGTLRWGLEADVDGINPTASALSAPGLTMSQAVFDSLVVYTKDGDWACYLCETFTSSDDLRTWTMKLRSGVTFHDGTPLNAEAIRVNFEAQRSDPLVGLAVKPFFPKEDATTIIDDLTIAFNLADPDAWFPTSLTGQLGYVASKVASEMETTLWQGAAGAAGGFTDGGFTTLAAAQAPGANQIAAVGGGVTAANVIDELGKVVDALNAQTNIYGYEDTRIFVSRNVMAAYVRALGGFAATGANGVDNRGTMWYADGGGVSFDGIKLFMAEGLPSNTMLAAQISNLYLGVSLLSDTQEARVIDVSQYDGSDNVRIIFRMAAGAQIGVASDVILYA